MAWAKLDDRFHENRKIRKAWKQCPSAVGLYVLALAYSAGNLTDGHIDHEFVEERLPVKRERDRAVRALCAAQLWHENGTGWHVNDFAEFNLTREAAEERRDKRSRAGKIGASTRWSDGKSHSNRITRDSKPKQVRITRNAPEPEPEPEPKGVDVSIYVSLCRRLAEAIRRNDPKALPLPRLPESTRKQWVDAARLLVEKDGRSVREVEAVIDWCQQDDFWRGNVLSMPKLRKQFSQLKLKMDGDKPRVADPPSPAELVAAMEKHR